MLYVARWLYDCRERIPRIYPWGECQISKLPKEFVSEKTTISANKTAIKEAIKKGIEVEGAHLETNENLIIK